MKTAASTEPVTDESCGETGATTVEITSIDKKAEIVTIKNTGSVVVDLSEWELVSERGEQTFFFPAMTLGAQETVYITSGSNAQDGGDYIKWNNANNWNNSKSDDGHLYDANGYLVYTYTN